MRQDQRLPEHRTRALVCNEHRTKWWCGSNLFSSRREEDETVWIKNRHQLATYREVEPIYPEPTAEERRQRAEYAAFTRLCEAIDRGYGIAFRNGVAHPMGPDDNP